MSELFAKSINNAIIENIAGYEVNVITKYKNNNIFNENEYVMEWICKDVHECVDLCKKTTAKQLVVKNLTLFTSEEYKIVYYYYNSDNVKKWYSSVLIETKDCVIS